MTMTLRLLTHLASHSGYEVGHLIVAARSAAIRPIV